jgi:uncharacterized protein YigE (DUF2233 family)
MDSLTFRLVVALLCLPWIYPPAAHGLEFRTVTYSGKKATICSVDLKTDDLRLFLNDDSGRPLKSFAALAQWMGRQNKRVVFAMNAGMFEPDYSPVGLFVSGGRQFNPLNLRDGFGNFYLKPNGVFAVTQSGAAVMESSQFQNIRVPVILATQSGPLLVSSGLIHPAFQPGSHSRLLRNGVGVASPHQVLFAIGEDPMNLYEFAALFRDALHCPNALFLDGTVSSLYAPGLGRNDQKIDLGPMIGVVQ